ncbi:g344 [Coccomyxa viridis]|uniref:G344 protein n=1 Tax=Coccomyxa viridis TaxID=1274662 RepID=A0ABP1FM81_9CHLO
MRTPDTQASSLQSREKEEFKDFEAGMELEGDSQSDTDSEDLRIEEALKTLNAQLTADKQGYDLFMEEILPLYEESRSHVGKPESEEYQIGFGHFLKSMEHRGDPEESGLSGWADREPPETLGHPPYSLRGRAMPPAESFMLGTRHQAPHRLAWLTAPPR